MEDIYELIEQWREYVECRNPFTFGEEEISLEDFAELAKNTFEIIKSANKDYLYKATYPTDISDAIDYLLLISVVSQYKTYDCMDDESEDKKFTATCLIAEELCNIATHYGFIKYSTDGTKTYSMSEENEKGIIKIYREDYPFYGNLSEELLNKTYSYDIYKKDFSEILEMAKTL